MSLLNMQAKRNSVIVVALVILAALCFCAGVTGCRDSDALTEVNYDQTSDNIDYNNPTKYLISNPNSTETNDTVPASETTDNPSRTTVERQNLVVYSSHPNTKKYTAKQSLWSKTPDFTGIEASSKVHFCETDDENAFEWDFGAQKLDKEKKTEEQQSGKSDQAQDTGDESTGGAGSTGKTQSDKSSDTQPSQAENGGGNGGDNEVAEDDVDQDDSGDDAASPSDTGGSSKSSSKALVPTKDTTGDFDDVPKVNRIAAYGQAAVLVQMIGGKGPLVAADSTLLKSAFSDVFSDEGASSIATGWKGDGTDASKIDVDAIIKAKADTILVYSSNYQKDISTADRKKLKAAGITFTIIRPLTSSSYIKKGAYAIGDMLDGSEALSSGWNPQKIADNYVDFHDKVVEAASDEANGGETKLAGSKTLEKGNEGSYSYDDGAKYTLLIDTWDTSVSLKESIDGWKPKIDGVGLSTVGYSTTPASFYIQAGGLVNTAATKGGSNAGQIVVWQFNMNTFSVNKSKWNYSSSGAFADSLNLSTNSSTGWDKVLFTAQSGKEATDYVVNKCFGTEDFPKIIAGTQQVKSKLIANSKKSSGIYHPYGLISSSGNGISVRSVGVLTSGGTILSSSIGTLGDDFSNALESKGQIPDSLVEVNPHGLFSSWTEATPESFLEAAWVNDVVNDDSDTVGWKTYVKDFYKKFYRYELNSTELSTIEKGVEK